MDSASGKENVPYLCFFEFHEVKIFLMQIKYSGTQKQSSCSFPLSESTNTVSKFEFKKPSHLTKYLTACKD